MYLMGRSLEMQPVIVEQAQVRLNLIPPFPMGGPLLGVRLKTTGLWTLELVVQLAVHHPLDKAWP